jgi:hypothetical protein
LAHTNLKCVTTGAAIVKTRGKKGDRKETLIFLAPFLLIVGTLVYLYVGSIQPGTLLVRALSAKGSPSIDLHAAVKVNGVEGTTPENLSLSQGIYNVTFLPLRWYYSPAPNMVSLVAGKSAYAVGVYTPRKLVFAFGVDGFNASSGLVSHNLTPVVWLNTSRELLDLSSSFGERHVEPGQNITFTFPIPGTFQFQALGTKYGGNVTVI